MDSCPSCQSPVRVLYQNHLCFDPSYPHYGVAQDNCLLKDVLLVDQITRNMVQCKHCGLCFVSPAFTPEELHRLYAVARMRDHYAKVKTSLPSPAENIDQPELVWKKEIPHSLFIFDQALRQIPNLSQRVVVDIGGRYGNYLAPFQKAGAQCFVQDYVQQDKLFPGVGFANKLKDLDQIDFAICTHVLEHIVDLKEWMIDVANQQNEGAFLYVEVPYELDSRLRNKNFGVPFHVNFFSEDSLTNVIESRGYKKIHVNLSRLTSGGNPMLVVHGLFQRTANAPKTHFYYPPILEIISGGLMRVADRYYPRLVTPASLTGKFEESL